MTRSLKASLKRSLYARRMTKDEIERIGAVPLLDIDGEIAYQRALIDRLAQSSRTTAWPSTAPER